MSDDHVFAIRAATDAARASARNTRAGRVSVGGDEWRRLLHTVDPEHDPTIVPFGRCAGMTLACIAATPCGDVWLTWAGNQPDGYWPDRFREELERFLAKRRISR